MYNHSNQPANQSIVTHPSARRRSRRGHRQPQQRVHPPPPPAPAHVIQRARVRPPIPRRRGGREGRTPLLPAPRPPLASSSPRSPRPLDGPASTTTARSRRQEGGPHRRAGVQGCLHGRGRARPAQRLCGSGGGSLSRGRAAPEDRDAPAAHAPLAAAAARQGGRPGVGGRGRKAGGRHPRGGIGPGAVAPVLLRLLRLRWLRRLVVVGVVGWGGRGLAEDVGEGPAEVLPVLGKKDLWVVVVCGCDKCMYVMVQPSCLYSAAPHHHPVHHYLQQTHPPPAS